MHFLILLTCHRLINALCIKCRWCSSYHSGFIMMMNAKFNEEVISGWANESDPQQEAILNHILKRKANLQLLPQINIFPQTQHHKQNHPLKNNPVKQKIQRQTHCLLKYKRERTQGCEQQHQKSPNFNNEKICPPLQLEELPKVTIMPVLTDYQPQEIVQRQSNHTEGQGAPPNRISNNLSSKGQEASTFFHTMRPKRANVKSHQIIPQLEKPQSPTKRQSRHYMKLSTLEMVNDLKKQFRYDLLMKFGVKPSVSDQRQYNDQRNRYVLEKNKETIDDKINEKFKQTFTKQDVFSKKRKKVEKIDRLLGRIEILEQNYPSDYTISADRQSLQSKMQPIRSSPRCRLIFK